jgi:hypothetical protein
MADFAIEFLTLAAESGWNTEATFHQGLTPSKINFPATQSPSVTTCKPLLGQPSAPDSSLCGLRGRR